MSLKTDIIFIRALQENTQLMAMLPAGGLYNTAIPLPDVEQDNTPLPYVLVSFDGMTNEGQTKDSFEGDTDRVNISVEIAAISRPQLAELVETVRTTIREFFENLMDDDEDYDMVPYDYQLTASAVAYDADKPCYWQVLTYQCETNRD